MDVKLEPCPLYGAQTTHKQQKVFLPTPTGCRKVVLCTNIAETSVTVPSIKYYTLLLHDLFTRYVIDSGMVKCRIYNSKIGMDVLAVVPVSKAQARQVTRSELLLLTFYRELVEQAVQDRVSVIGCILKSRFPRYPRLLFPISLEST